MIEIPPGLREAIKVDELVLFVGAGLSWNFKNKKNETLEGWTKMASSITSYLCDNGHILENLKQACDTLGEIKTLEILEEREIGIGEVGPFIREYFTLGDGNDFSLQKKLFELSTKIITTNYDRAFEMAVPQLQSQKAYKGKDYELNGLKKDPVFLFKLHGCIEHLDSMVLFPSDYGKLYNSNRREAEHTLSALRNLIFNKTFLFIGTGLGDPQINSFFEEIKIIQGPYNQKHYIITPDPLEKSLDFLTRIPITSYEEIPGVIDQLLEIKRAEDEKNTPLKEQLKETEKRNEVLAKELEEVKDEHKKNLLLLEWESNNRFNKGVRHHLAGEYPEASEEYGVATVLNPRNSEAFCNWGATLSDLAETKSGIEAEKLYDEAIEKYQKAIEYKQDYYEAYYNWGATLSDLAETKSGIEAEKLYDEAIEKYQKAIEYKLDYYEAYNNWGATLSDLAKTKSGIEAEKLYDEAIEKYQKAIEYKLDYYEVYNNWGNALSDWAKTKSGIEAEKLYDEAIEKYQKAIECKPDFYAAYNNWGATLSDLAKTKSGIEAEKLYDEAIEKYQKAIEYKLDYYEAYNNWGATLSDWAKIKSGSEAEELYDKAFEKFQQAIKYGGGSYNLACLYALRNRKEGALKYLDHALSRGKVSVKLVEEDNDWDAFREDPDFKRLLSQYKGK